ncbi:hypothetical protein [Nocardiopsis sp. CC223A]|uniref:hypothetical protein n=1 Tax=Nocardiopsis sp. CC223A TaxID=3044051 RepID=UPI00278C3D37|nr:hypothetical protein [Nocardiopsis sp. CC223A]
MERDNSVSPPDLVLLLGAEVGLDGDVLSIRDPALRTLTVEHLPTTVELGAALIPAASLAGENEDDHLRLEVLRPSGSAALSLSDALTGSAHHRNRPWARTLQVVIDEVGIWQVTVRVGASQAYRTLKVTVEGWS